MADKPTKTRFYSTLEKQQEPTALPALLELMDVNIPARTARNWLADWIEQGLVEKRGEKRGARYWCINRVALPEYLQGLDRDLQQSLSDQVRDLWTHHSTALEGNTLSLGDTQFLLQQGLTVSGKPLKDHQEIIGHARAIEIIYSMLAGEIKKESIFELHKAVQTELVTDIYKPNGAWKLEINSTYAVDKNNKQVFIEYAKPRHVEKLMKELISEINSAPTDVENAHKVHAKIHMGVAHIHPFWDGNGRMARLLANVPLLKAGLPPLVIPIEKRREYIDTLAAYQISIGQLTNKTGVWPQVTDLQIFEEFCESSYQSTQGLMERARKLQLKRAEEND